MQTLPSPRLTLRDFSYDDVDFLFDLYSRWEVQRYIGVTPTVMQNREQAEALVARRLHAVYSHPAHGVWLVQGNEGVGPVGVLLLKDIPASSELSPLPPSGVTEIGWHFHPDCWGNGYATEAATAVLASAFASDIEQVVAVTYPENGPSQQVCRRLGMTHQGQTSRFYNAVCELFSLDRPSGSNAAGPSD